MSKLKQLLAELCQGGVEYGTLDSVLENNNAKETISKHQYLEIGRIPIIDQSQKFIVGYTDNMNSIPASNPSIIFGDHTRVVKYADFNFAQGDSGTKVFKAKSSNLLEKFIYYAFSNLEIASRGYNRHWSIVKNMKIPIPPMEVQEEIVRILDKFTILEAELEAELEARRKQYEYYRDELVGLKNGYELKTLGEIAHYSNTRIDATKVDQDSYVGVDNLLPNRSGKTFSTYVPTNGRLTEYQEEDILIGNIRPYLKKIWFSNNRGGTNGDVLVIRLYDNYASVIKPRYIYQTLSTDIFFEYSMQHSKGSKMPRGNKEATLNFQIPVPPLEKQERIVAILDRFDVLVNDLTAGLPAEIAARRKQYEYYREKLLTFKEKAG